jgi:hypothetical protein
MASPLEVSDAILKESLSVKEPFGHLERPLPARRAEQREQFGW